RLALAVTLRPALRMAPPSPPANPSFCFLKVLWCGLKRFHETFSHKKFKEEKKAAAGGSAIRVR
ncbi:hypothetical protein, partial [Pantoea sp. UBA4549]|uniref:hypothetical protein n=1 Tax=Pantoea sp. UBA4549 TaxID=1947033 RepID=UPI0025F131A8